MKKLFIGIIIGFLFSVALVRAELIVKGKSIIYAGNVVTGKPTITESADTPTSPRVNDIWRDTANNIVYIYNGSAWVVKNATVAIKNEIQVFKDNIAGVNDIKARKCLNALKKMVFKLYQEE